MPRIKRRRLLVTSFQYRLILYQVVYSFLVLAVVFIAGIVPLMRKIGDPALPLESRAEQAEALLLFHENVLPVIVPVFFLLIFHSVKVSHRIAGPIYRFRAVLTALGKGDIAQRVRLRPKDYLTEEARVFDETIQGLGKRLAAIQEHADAARIALEGSSRKTDQLDSSAALEVRQRLTALSAELQFFTLPGHGGSRAASHAPASNRPVRSRGASGEAA